MPPSVVLIIPLLAKCDSVHVTREIQIWKTGECVDAKLFLDVSKQMTDNIALDSAYLNTFLPMPLCDFYVLAVAPLVSRCIKDKNYV